MKDIRYKVSHVYGPGGWMVRVGVKEDFHDEASSSLGNEVSASCLEGSVSRSLCPGSATIFSGSRGEYRSPRDRRL